MTYVRVPRTDGITSSWLRIAVPAEASGVLRNNNALLATGRFAIGETVQGAMEIRRTLIDQAPTADTSGLALQMQAIGRNTLVSDLDWSNGQDNHAVFDQYGMGQTEPW
jgi:hypothetical protein